MSHTAVHWTELNQRALAAALAEVRAVLERRSESPGTPDAKSAESRRPAASKARLKSQKKTAAAAPPLTALDTLMHRFSLSAFERAVLLLCAGVEFDAGFAQLCASAHGDPRCPAATFGLALAALPGAHWSALAPTAPLRRWHLVEPLLDGGEGLTRSPLRIDERVLHYLAGVQYLDPRLRGLFEHLDTAAELSPNHVGETRRIVAAWAVAGEASACPVIELTGNDLHARLQVAAAACGFHRLRLHRLRAEELPVSPAERSTLARIWEREALLTESALLVSWEEDAPPETTTRARSFVEQIQGIVLVSSPAPLKLPARPTLRVTLDRPAVVDQLALWHAALGPAAASLNGHIARVAAQFSLDAPAIRSAAAEVVAARPRDAGAALWQACRVQARPALDGLAHRIDCVAGWSDLVLPEAQLQTLQTIVAQVRQRGRVCEAWGFGRKSARGLGLSVLFAGPSGTGKTMAAEVLARELQLDLHRIDLSGLVSKYIGETEKNLRRVFDAAEHGGSILLFDEADALFGKRSEVRDSHDRYANIEVSYLLQRIEAYRGLAILTTNQKQAIDSAFARRLRFIVPFNFPDAVQRLEIWRRVFPTETPVQGLDFQKLARLSLAGGHIRNLALNAAFLAADAGQPVRMKHLFQAAQSEYAKLEKPLSEAETEGWL